MVTTRVVAAAVADLRASNPELTPSELRQQLIATADRPGVAVPDQNVGWGVINPVSALTAPAGDAGPTPAPPSEAVSAVVVDLPPEAPDNSWSIVIAGLLLALPVGSPPWLPECGGPAGGNGGPRPSKRRRRAPPPLRWADPRLAGLPTTTRERSGHRNLRQFAVQQSAKHSLPYVIFYAGNRNNSLISPKNFEKAQEWMMRRSQ